MKSKKDQELARETSSWSFSAAVNQTDAFLRIIGGRDSKDLPALLGDFDALDILLGGYSISGYGKSARYYDIRFAAHFGEDCLHI